MEVLIPAFLLTAIVSGVLFVLIFRTETVRFLYLHFGTKTRVVEYNKLFTSTWGEPTTDTRYRVQLCIGGIWFTEADKNSKGNAVERARTYEKVRVAKVPAAAIIYESDKTNK